uniref:MARVEL domain-containing protein n=1 Tax=Syphacia muris TaxID=451379 RepID=A0A0N5APL7_9BILA
MGTEYLRSVHGILTAVQVFLGFGALFASSFIWDNTNVYIQLGYKGYGWQTLVLAILLFTWLVSVGILVLQLTDRDIIGQLGKLKLLILYAISCGLMIVAASLESWYSKKTNDDLNYQRYRTLYRPRFIVVTVFSWILVVIYAILILVTLLFS